MATFPSAATAEDVLPSLRGGEREEAWEEAGREDGQYRVRERIRTECRAALAECAANRRTAMSWEDVQEYERTGLREETLAFTQSEEEKTQVLLQHKAEYVPLFIRQTEEAGAKALASIDEAVEKKWITAESGRRWGERLKSGGAGWLERRHFIENQLPQFVQNWKAVAEDWKNMEKLAQELGVTAKEWENVPELATLKGKDFTEKHFHLRRGALDRAIAYLNALRKDGGKGVEGETQRLYKIAEAKLTRAAQNGFLANWKVGTWLRRIFQSEARQDLIRKFVEGGKKDGTTLEKLIDNWAKVSMEYMDIEETRKEKGTPRSFHFVKLEVFLGWDYEKRRAYVREARNRFSDPEQEREGFLYIRHALDTKDWEEAEMMLAEERKHLEEMTPEEVQKFHSLEQFLHTHRLAGSPSKEQNNPSDREIVEQARELVGPLPVSLQQLYIHCMQYDYGTFWRLTSIIYNRVWLRRHKGVDTKREMQWLEEAELFTAQRAKEGHGRGLEANDTRGTNSKSSSIRDQERLVAPQILVMGADEGSARLNAQTIHRNTWWSYWYWTNGLPVENGVPLAYGRQEEIVDSVNPQLKRLMRETEKRGILYTQSGDIRYKPTGKAKPLPTPSLN